MVRERIMVIITEKKNQNNSIEERQKVDVLRGDDLIRKEHGSHTRVPKGLFDVSGQQFQFMWVGQTVSCSLYIFELH